MRNGWLAILFVISSSPGWAEDTCQWLPVEQVAEALPSLGPWQTTAGGEVGACQFLGRSRRGLTILAINQMVQESPGKAVDFVSDMRRNLGRPFVVEPMATLGKHGFSYRSSDEADASARNSLFLVGHKGRVVAMGSLTVSDGVPESARKGFLLLTLRAFDLADDSVGMEAATRCPYFDQDVLRKLFKGAAFSQQAYGANSCIA
jgi:hypothetical protein